MGGPPSKLCEEQLYYTWSLTISPDLIDHIDHLIQKSVNEGRQRSIDNVFLLYVTGYAESFNEVNTGCDEVPFARAANPVDDRKEHTKLTTALRKEFKDMGRHLNQLIEKTVERNKNQGVKFIDIQAHGALDEHRFCEKGVKKPYQHNDKLFFWHYPYNEPRDNELSLLTTRLLLLLKDSQKQISVSSSLMELNIVMLFLMRLINKHLRTLMAVTLMPQLFGTR